MKELAPHYKIPSKNTIKKKLDEKYNVTVQIFKRKLNEILYVTISINTWSKEESCKSFLRIRIHFIASGTKKLESGNIEIIELYKYTIDYIACALLNALIKWCIDISKTSSNN